MRCWEAEAEKRPTFIELCIDLTELAKEIDPESFQVAEENDDEQLSSVYAVVLFDLSYSLRDILLQRKCT